MSRRWHLWLLTPIGLALAASFVAHLALIAGVTFAPPAPKIMQDNTATLEVVLVNTRSKSAPTKADALAQVNLDRGGNTDADRRMKSAMPVPNSRPKSMTAKLAAESAQNAHRASPTLSEQEKREQHVAELEKQTRKLMTQLKSEHKVDTPTAPASTAITPDQGQDDVTPKKQSTADMVAQSLEIARMEAIIAKEQDEYQKRPKRKFLGANVRESRFAAYVDSWRQKVERVGTLNYPQEAKAKRIYGSLRMTVNIKSDGSVESVEINRSSGYRELDEAAKRIVEMAAPYAEFPPNIRSDAEILVITRTWTFTRDETLGSSE